MNNHTLSTRLELLPEALLASSPAVLCLGYASALLYRADSWRLAPATLALLEKLFQMAEKCYRVENDLPRLGEVFAFRALAAWRQDDAIEGARSARQALSWLAEGQQFWRALSLFMVGKAELLYHGRVDVGREMLVEASTLCEATDHRHFRLSLAMTDLLVRAFFEQGELHRSCEYYQKVLLRNIGSDRSVYRYLATLKQAEIQAPVNVERIKKYTPNTAVWLLVRDPKTLNEIEQEDLVAILRASPALKKAYELIKRQGYGRAGFALLRKRILYAI